MRSVLVLLLIVIGFCVNAVVLAAGTGVVTAGAAIDASAGAHASVDQTIHCAVYLNTNLLYSKQFKSQSGVKTKWADLEGLTAYLSEKDSGRYEIEAFVASEDLRFYSEGEINERQPLSASLWTRQQIIDLKCEK